MNVHEPEKLTVGSKALAIGTACVLSDGLLIAATASTKPTYVTLAAGESGDEIPCGRIESNQVYEVPVSAAPTASLKVGVKVTLDTTGQKVTATVENGVATIVSVNGATAAGDLILVRF